MELCAICRSIPFASLPKPLDFKVHHWLYDDGELVEFVERRKKFSDDETGFPWHSDIKALAESAKTGCPLCAAVQNAVEHWFTRYDKANTGKFYEEFGENYEVEMSQLRLTQRFNDAPGLMVFTRNTCHADKNHAFIALCSLAFSVESNDPLSSKLLLRPPSLNSGSPESLDLLSEWLTDCVERHEHCSGAETPLPTRLLDVSAPEDIIKLVEPEAGTTGKFASLSYCWGSSLVVSTTQKSHQDHVNGIRLAELPQTFQDAIRVTRHLGLQYLWLDSLCILQDDQEDWARESARMLDIYSNAYVVIAATRASDSSAGCFHNRPARFSSVGDIPGIGRVNLQSVGIDHETDKQFDFESEPLTKRAWALQKRVLARRVIHYGSRQMFFECHHGIVSEDGCRAEVRYCSLHKIQQKEETTSGVRRMWNSLVYAYGHRSLTNITDKYLALSGIARLCGNALEEDYVAGLWSGNLVKGLAWQGIGKPAYEPTEYVGPSWSWASYPAIAAPSRSKNFKDIASIEGWDVQLRNKDDPYGQVESAYIKVRGPFTRLEPSTLLETELEVRLKRADMTPHPRFRTKYSTEDEGMMLIMDDKDDRAIEKWQKGDISVLILSGYLWDKDETGAKAEKEGKPYDKEYRMGYGMVLVQTRPGEKDSEMKRIGWMFVDSGDLAMLRQTEEDWQTVTIV
jgi:hypothetical protein